MYKRLAWSVMLAVSAPVLAQHAAHEHGVADLRVAADGNTVVIEFDTPLDNLVGFEHAPRDDAQRDALRNAEDRLASFDVLFALTPAAGCTLREVQIESPYPQGEHAHGDGHDHGHDHNMEDGHGHAHGHAEKDHHGHEHEKKGHAHDEKHGHDRGHKHDHDHKHGHDHDHGHADMYAVYELECADIAALNEMEVRLIETFPRISTLRVETATAAGQQSVRVREASAKVGL